MSIIVDAIGDDFPAAATSSDCVAVAPGQFGRAIDRENFFSAAHAEIYRCAVGYRALAAVPRDPAIRVGGGRGRRGGFGEA